MIELEGVSKRYRLYRSPIHRIRDWIRWRPSRAQEVWALNDVSFQLKGGEALGVVGWNGAGKSTLLRILAGITRPTSGRIAVGGERGTIWSSAGGFTGELSGRANLLLNAPLLGVPRSQIAGALKEIRELTGLGDMLEYPVRTYSTGMKARLSFGLAVLVESPIMLFDEFLGGVDQGFRARAAETFLDWRDEGRTLVIVSHRTELMEKVCTCVLWLHEGRIKAMGAPGQILKGYSNYTDLEAPRRSGKGMRRLVRGARGPGPKEFSL